MAGLVGVAALAVGAWALRPALQARLEAAIRRQAAGALAPAGGSLGFEGVRTLPPADLALERVSLEAPDGTHLEARSVRVGLDLTEAVRASYGGSVQRALRRLEARGVVIRQAAPRQAAPGGGAGADRPASDPGPDPETLRRAVLQVFELLGADLTRGLQPGQSVEWDVEGVWEGASGTERLPFHTRGRLVAGRPGLVDLEGRLEMPALAAGGTARLEPDAVTLSRLRLAFTGGEAELNGTLHRAGGDRLTADLRVSLRRTLPSGQLPAPAAFTVAFGGPWPEGGLPVARVSAELPEGARASAGWWTYLRASRAEAQVAWEDGALRLQDGRWARGEARGRFTGTVGLKPPYPVQVDFELSRLRPGRDLPWWEPYRVGALDARGRLAGSVAGGDWGVEGELQAVPGLLAGVPAGPASARVVANLSGGIARVERLAGPMGSGQLDASGEVRWGPGARGAAGADPEVSVQLLAAGRLDAVDPMEVARVVGSLVAGMPPALVEGGARPPGEVTGRLEVEAAWVRAGRELRGQVRRLAFDGPDGSVRLMTTPGGRELRADLVNLGGALLRPWLQGIEGIARAEGALQAGRLEAELVVERLRVREVALGRLHLPVRLDEGRLEVGPAQLSGGLVEGRAALRVDGASPPAGGVQADLRAGEALGIPAALLAEGIIEPGRTHLQQLEVLVAGRPVASASGTLPVGWRAEPRTDGELDVRVRLEGLPLELVRQLAPGWQVEDGELTGQMRVSGALAEPWASGRAHLRATRLQAPGFPGLLEAVDLELRVAGRELEIIRGAARTAQGGRIGLEGRARLASAWPPALDPVDLNARLEGAWLSGPVTPQLDVAAAWTGWLRLQGALGPGSAPLLRGELEAARGQVALWRQGLPALLAGLGGLEGGAPRLPPAAAGTVPAAGTGGKGDGPRAGLALDVRVRLQEPAQVEVPPLGGSGVAQGELRLGGTLARPTLQGELALRQARLLYLGREVSLDEGRLLFSPARGVWPGLDLRASTRGADGPVRLRVQGDASPGGSLTFSSDPPMSQEELAGLLLSPPAGEQGAAERWLARLNDQLAAWAVAPLERALRQALGLDVLRAPPVMSEQRWTLELGKYLFDHQLYVGYVRSVLGAGPQGVELSARLQGGLTAGAGWVEGEGTRLKLTWDFHF